MSETKHDREIAALQTCATALSTLDPAERGRVLGYLLTRFPGPASFQSKPNPPNAEEPPTSPAQRVTERSTHASDIRTFKEQKRPETAVEMAAVVAYYLSELAPEDDRSETLSTATFLKYCKQASFPLPGTPQTLKNAKKAGYLESAARGSYKLTPVGHNLVVHRLPRKVTSTP
jgi:hypothetical protein